MSDGRTVRAPPLMPHSNGRSGKVRVRSGLDADAAPTRSRGKWPVLAREGQLEPNGEIEIRGIVHAEPFGVCERRQFLERMLRAAVINCCWNGGEEIQRLVPFTRGGQSDGSINCAPLATCASQALDSSFA